MQHVIDHDERLRRVANRMALLKMMSKATSTVFMGSAVAIAGCLLLVRTMSGMVATSADSTVMRNDSAIALLSVPAQSAAPETWRSQVQRIAKTLPQVADALLKAPSAPSKAAAPKQQLAAAPIMPSISEALELAAPKKAEPIQQMAKADQRSFDIAEPVARVAPLPPQRPVVASMPAAVPLPLAKAPPQVAKAAPQPAKAAVPLPPVAVAQAKPKPVPLPMATAATEVAITAKPPKLSPKPKVLPARTKLAMARKPAPAATAPVDHRSFFEKMFGVQPKSAGSALAYAPSHYNSVSLGNIFSNHSSASASAGTAVYNIAQHTVILPNGARLEAHSGLGGMIDNPHYVNVRMRGPTPPHLYDLTYRRRIFHGVQALRLTPVGGGTVYGRSGLLAHSFMLGARGDSNGCVSFRNYQAFLQAFRSGEVKRLLVVAGT